MPHNKDTHPSGDVEHIIPTNRTHIYELLLYLNGSRAVAFYNYVYL